MRTFEYRLYPNKGQSHLLMACLAASRLIYNEMLETVKAHYAENKIKLHRLLEGQPKTVHLVYRADGHWYALIVCETEPPTQQASAAGSHPAIGIDVGLKSFLTDSEGRTVENPRFYRTSHKTLRRKQRQLSRRKKGSHRRHKVARSTAHTHLKMARQRRDFHYKAAKPYAEQYQVIVVEKPPALAVGSCHLLYTILI